MDRHWTVQHDLKSGMFGAVFKGELIHIAPSMDNMQQLVDMMNILNLQPIQLPKLKQADILGFRRA